MVPPWIPQVPAFSSTGTRGNPSPTHRAIVTGISPGTLSVLMKIYLICILLIPLNPPKSFQDPKICLKVTVL